MKLKLFFVFIFTVFILFYSTVTYLFHQYSFYEKTLKFKNTIGKEKIIGKVYSLGFNILTYASNEFDIIRVYNKIKNEEPESTNLLLSSADVSDLESQIKLFKKKGFIKDELNYWRKAKLKKGNKEFDIKYKFHGTSLSSLKGKHLSLRIRLANDEPYLDKVREFNLIKIFFNSDENIPTIIFNNLANKIGLLSPIGETTILKINGVTIGFYYKQERHGKEWFEKKQITNYSILKTNDDWDKKKYGHESDLDLDEKNIEVSGSSINTDIAVGSIKKLFDAINSKDVKKIFRLIDKDYFAKFLALSTLYNDNHPITGDNLKYIYDLTRGKFKVLYRQESGNIIPISGNLENFNNALFDSNIFYRNALSHNLFKLILTDNDFRLKRDFYLNQILTDKINILQEAEETYNNAYKNLIFSDVKLRHQKYLKSNFFRVINNNFDKIEKYLNYVKIYASNEKKENLSKLFLINDSYIPHRLKAVYFGKEKINFNESEEYLLSSVIVKEKKNYYPEKKIKILSKKNITNIEFENVLTKKIIDQEHIYINKIKNYEITDNQLFLNSLEVNNINYDFNGNQLLIKKGDYVLTENIVIYPDIKTTIEKGTKFKLKKNISVLIQGDLYAEGTENENIYVIRYEKEDPFGTFAIIGKNKTSKVKLNNFTIEGGSEATIEGMVFLGQLSIHNSETLIINSKIIGSTSDDGANIRNSYVEIFNTTFLNNKFDQLDLDFCNGKIFNNFFASSKNLKIEENDNANFNGDGIDLSGSNIIIKNNKISNFKDKGLSIGEKSRALVEKNHFERNKIAIAIKDESISYTTKNTYSENELNYSMYIKKFFFDKPTLYLNKNDYTKKEVIELNENKNIKNFQFDDGTINFIDKLNQKNFYKSFENEIISSRI